ncbi:MAG TPA: ADOP family duplicated permease [Bryobacteraceae bacterium]|jgi:predicted permease|nr:ADOP family duplicated permease [Bryobacteraceae bacterium]
MRQFLLKLWRRRRLQRDLETELAFHREMSGQHGNRIPLGNPGLIKEQSFDLWRFNFIENLCRDVVYAARGFRRSPGLVATALLSLGLGIGVNAAMFSLGLELLFSQPSVRDPGSLVSIRLGGNSNSPEEALNFLRRSGLFQDVAGENVEAFTNFNDGTETHRAFAVYTTKNYFTMLGVPVLYGRGIIPKDPTEVAVLSYRFWQKYFHGDSSILGRAINLDGRACTVVGILPEHHRTLLGVGFSPGIYLPRWLDTTTLQIYARLRPGMSLRAARAGLNAIARRMDAAMPASGPTKYATGISVWPVGGFGRFASGDVPELAPIGIFFAVLLLIVGLVLLIACINVATLLIARGSARRTEIAIRLALGVSRARLLQQFLAESALLALLGGALGLLLSRATATLLARIDLPFPVPIHLQITPDWRVLVYSVLLTLLATIVCGVLPAWQSLRASITSDLARDRRSRVQSALVIAQIATSVIVLITGFLFLRNLVSANAISPGFDVRHTLRAEVNLPPSSYSTARQKSNFINETLRELAGIPGIEAVAAARVIPFNGNVAFGSTLSFPDNGQQRHAYFKWNAVTPSFFRVMDIHFYAGSTFRAIEHGGKVVIVNRVFVERYLGQRQPLGTVIQWGADHDAPYRIVGVVEGTKTITIGETPQAQLYEPLTQIENDQQDIQFVARSAIPPALQLDPLRRALHRIEPMAGAEVETMYSSIGFAFLPSKIGAVLLGSIGVLGLLLATIGLYGVMAYAVAQRTRGIGIRMAIGATRGNISRMVLHDAVKLMLTGSAIGLFTALLLTKPLAMFLVPGLKPADPLSFATVLIVMIFTGLVAASGPVRRAVTVDPNRALRVE